MANLGANSGHSSVSIGLPGQTALGDRAKFSSANPNGGKAGLVVREVAHLGKLNIRGDKTLAPAIKAHTGCAFPPASNRINSTGARHVLWLGPDESLLLCEAGREDELLRVIHADAGARHCAITNVTDGLCALQLAGSAVRQVLAKGCAIDLHPRAFGPGDCVQTLLSHAAITLVATDDNEFLMICRTSFAPYVMDWLQDAALEYGFDFKG